MEQDKYTFYALNVNGYTAAIYASRDEALSELTIRFKEDDSDRYEIEPLNGIWRMLVRLSNFEDREDDPWMINVVSQVSTLIRVAQELSKTKTKDSPQKQTADKNKA